MRRGHALFLLAWSRCPAGSAHPMPRSATSCLSGIFAGWGSCWSGEYEQLVGGVDVTVVVRWVPGLTLGCGTRMARQVRTAGGEVEAL